MVDVELEKRNLINRYNELKLLVKPILNEERLKILFNKDLDNYNSEMITNEIVMTLNRIGGMVSSGVFLIILINYKDLIESDPVKIMRLAVKSKRDHSIVL